ncbi:7826_t:CDS:2, partial [Gigaspora rosea]
ETPICCQDGCISKNATCCNNSQSGYCNEGFHCCATGCCPNK